MANNKKYKNHKNNKKPKNFTEYQLEDMSYDELCEYADFLCEFFKTVEEIAPLNEEEPER